MKKNKKQATKGQKTKVNEIKLNNRIDLSMN